MRIMRMHEAFPGYGGKDLFCGKKGLQNKFWGVQNGKNASYCLMCLMFWVIVRQCGLERMENMRIMRIYEDRLFREFFMPCIYGDVGSRENMRQT